MPSDYSGELLREDWDLWTTVSHFPRCTIFTVWRRARILEGNHKYPKNTQWVCVATFPGLTHAEALRVEDDYQHLLRTLGDLL